MPTFHRLAHMKDTPLVKVGDWVKRGQLIGYCGTSGASTGAHLHYDIFNTDKLGWTFYVYGWSLAKVKSVFSNPVKYIKDKIPMDNAFPYAGYEYLQYVRSSNYYHPGIDCNGLNDMGKPIYAPVEGRVKAVYGTSWIKNLWGKLIKQDYNSGWGNMVVIEEMPNYKIE
jgi:murein DD-endopeptidase MepM/ murein hydrolase activator NlpD